MSSVKLSPSRHKKRTCEYGDEHVSRNKYDARKEELQEEISRREREIEEKNEELLRQHNLLADLSTKLDQAKDEVRQSKAEILKKEKEIEESINDFNQVCEERDENERGLILNKERGEKFKNERDSLRQELQNTKRKAREETLRLESENKKLKTKSTALEEQLEQRISQLFTPEPQAKETLTKKWEEAAEKTLGTPDEESEWNPDTFEQQLRLLTQTLNQALEEEIPDLCTAVHEISERFPNQAQAIRDLSDEVRQWRLRHQALGNERDQTEHLRLEAAQEAERQRSQAHELREEISEWETISLAYQEDIETSPAAVRKTLEDLLRENKEKDLGPIRALHPSLQKLPSAGTRGLARALTEAIAWELTTLWQKLPHPAEEDLITPETQVGDILRRIQRAADQLTRASITETRNNEEAKKFAREITRQEEQTRRLLFIFKALLEFCAQIAQDGKTRWS
jgi:hypothetical protein